MHRSPKILHLSTYDQFGGAAKAAFRILESQSKSGINCSMFTLVKKTTSVLVKKIESSNLKVRIKLAHDQISNYRNQILEKSEELHSYGNISAGIIDQINNSDSDIINLHWIISMLSIEDIGKIKKPIVWTLHDMWPFCSHEHYLLSPEKMLKYSTTDPKKLQEYEHDINMETWLRKWKYWNKNNFILICPSRFIAKYASQSSLFKNCKMYVIPNPIDNQHTWKPYPKNICRNQLGISNEKKILLFVTPNPLSDKIKGYDLLEKILQIFHTKDPKKNIDLMITREVDLDLEKNIPYKIHWLGNINDEGVMAKIYSTADLVCLPSRFESFSQVALEAHSCGTPVVTFDSGGPCDIVDHQKTGWVANMGDIDGFAEGIGWVLKDEKRLEQLSIASRKNSIEKFSPPIIAKLYEGVYDDIYQKSR